AGAPGELRDEVGGRWAVVPNEYVRLEGYQWARGRTAWGGGTVYSVARFGSLGQGVLVPSFCRLAAPPARLVVDGPSRCADARHRCPEAWLLQGLRELRDGTRASRRGMLPEELYKVASALPGISVSMPCALLQAKDAPSVANFGRRATRRNPLYVDAVELGAKVRLSIAPAIQLPSRGLGEVNTELESRGLGVRLFQLAGGGFLCVAQEGGPQMNSVELDGATLEDACHYITAEWASELEEHAATWTQLSVRICDASSLEEHLGPAPGRGVFRPLHSAGPAAVLLEAQACVFCGARPVVGLEVPEEAEEAAGRSAQGLAVCETCSAFVPKSAAFAQKKVLAEFISKPADKIVGTANEGLDRALLLRKAPEAPRMSETDGWQAQATAAVPGLVVVAACALLRLARPRNWDSACTERLRSRVQEEVGQAVGCGRLEVSIPSADPDASGGAIICSCVFVHPVIALGPNERFPLEGTQDDTRFDAPAKYLGLLAAHLASGGAKWQPVPLGSRDAAAPGVTKTVMEPPVLRAADGERAVLPCGLLACQPPPRELRGPGGGRGGAVDSPPLAVDDAPPVTARKSLPMPRRAIADFSRLGDTVPEDSSSPLRLRPTENSPWSFSPASSRADATRSTGSRALPGEQRLGRGVQRGIDARTALQCFQPTQDQLRTRLCQMAGTGEAERCKLLLVRWSDSRGEGGGAVAWEAVLSRVAGSFRGQSALDIAIAYFRADTAQALLQCVPADGTDPRIAELLDSPSPVTRRLPLNGAMLNLGEKAAQVAGMLVQRRADVNSMKGLEPPMALAVRLGRADLVTTLLGFRGDANLRLHDGATLLHWAVAGNWPGVLQALLDDPGCDVDAADSRGRTALVPAIRGAPKSGAVLDALLRARADVNARDLSGARPVLQLAAIQDAATCAKVLQAGADRDAEDPADGSRLVHLAAEASNAVLLRQLLAERADIHAPHPKDGRSLLHLAVGRQMAQSVRELLALQASVDAASRIGDTPLRAAVQARAAARGAGDAELELVGVLLAARANPNAPNAAGCAPIHAAAAAGDEPATRLLLEHGADARLADARLWRPLHFGAAAGAPAGVIGRLFIAAVIQESAAASSQLEPSLAMTPTQMKEIVAQVVHEIVAAGKPTIIDPWQKAWDDREQAATADKDHEYGKNEKPQDSPSHDDRQAHGWKDGQKWVETSGWGSWSSGYWSEQATNLGCLPGHLAEAAAGAGAEGHPPRRAAALAGPWSARGPRRVQQRQTAYWPAPAATGAEAASRPRDGPSARGPVESLPALAAAVWAPAAPEAPPTPRRGAGAAQGPRCSAAVARSAAQASAASKRRAALAAALLTP
ncbi:unnamed protein product, partial [Prorocentrum cordatum]